MPSESFQASLKNISPQTKAIVSIQVQILERVQYLLEKQGYLQGDFIYDPGKKGSAINKWIYGERDCSLKNLVNLQVELGEPIIEIPPVPKGENSFS
jgi:hypothetical protein